jgi:hypothetical protein
MITPAPQFYHIGLAIPSGVDPKSIEAAINQNTLDWMRYSSTCYVVWTTGDASMLSGALLTVPGMRAGYFLVVKMDLSDSFGWLPGWLWEWLKKERPPQLDLSSLFPLLGPQK